MSFQQRYVRALLKHLYTVCQRDMDESVLDSIVDRTLEAIPPAAHLEHVTRSIPQGGQVVLLDTGAVLGPEITAMLQALYSRDPRSVFEHLKLVMEKGAQAFMQSYYVGYNHKSIGDCGEVCLFIEGVSMLAAKAIQDHMLYCGQEVSTRYVDFAKVPFITPTCARADDLVALQEAWRREYLHALPQMIEAYQGRYPYRDDYDRGAYDRAINAKAFDAVRSLLPAGASTSVAWMVNLRQAGDRIAQLRHHPLMEVRCIADAIEHVLISRYPNTFTKGGHPIRYEETERYHAIAYGAQYYKADTTWWGDEQLLFTSSIDHSILLDIAEVGGEGVDRNLLAIRPPKTELPKYLAQAGEVQFQFPLDFGSYRDIQRHRAVNQRLPLLTTDHGFELWYLKEFPDAVCRSVTERLKIATDTLNVCIEDGNVAEHELQYAIPMGYRVPCNVTGDLPAIVYLVELRATRFVHPTLRTKASRMAKELMGEFEGFGLVLHLDQDPDAFDVKRGTQTIIKK